MDIRTLAALAAVIVCAAKSGYAASAVQTARERDATPVPASLDDSTGTLPESPLEIGAPLAARTPGLEIQLDASEPTKRDASPLEVPVDVSLQLN